MPVFLVLFQALRGLTSEKGWDRSTPKYIDQDTELFKSLDGTRRRCFLGIDLSESASGKLQDDSFVRHCPTC